jgi:hypothetical protein
VGHAAVANLRRDGHADQEVRPLGLGALGRQDQHSTARKSRHPWPGRQRETPASGDGTRQRGFADLPPGAHEDQLRPGREEPRHGGLGLWTAQHLVKTNACDAGERDGLGGLVRADRLYLQLRRGRPIRSARGDGFPDHLQDLAGRRLRGCTGGCVFPAGVPMQGDHVTSGSAPAHDGASYFD